MSNAAASYYLYLAQNDRDKARIFRRFGYLASADFVERRAERYEARADRESKEAPQDHHGASRFTREDDSDLHITSGLAVDVVPNLNESERLNIAERLR